MSRRLTPITILLALAALALGAAQGPRRIDTISAPQPLVVHEWGTWTSMTGADGRAVEWFPLNGPPDLPCFVDRFAINIKCCLAAKIRMETPVLYFYTSWPVRLNVTVRFRRGAVTEWFPRAAVTPASVDGARLRRPDFSSSITWNDVKVGPDARTGFQVDGSGSHYYVARQTDASPLQVGSQKEKFLFYRGVGSFEPPIDATVASDGRVTVENPDGDPIGDAIMFENAGGMIAWQARRGSGSQVVFDPSSGDGEISPPHAELEQILIAHGLYPKEARAMIDTWRDTWFKEGRRIFYIVSRNTIDSILPLDINPSPSEIVRVFVGRIELETQKGAAFVPRAPLSGCPR
ncbi:MAG TPA: hypothetical protein VGQ16_07805 [Vicinamibacterales bacterium]|nr:hypothetical protein [Vicinamibacterales bacterium]